MTELILAFKGTTRARIFVDKSFSDKNKYADVA